jgi:signal transduction histidine kinase
VAAQAQQCLACEDVRLGLYIARSIITQYHGRVSVESVPGKGATFRCELPLAVTAGMLYEAQR